MRAPLAVEGPDMVGHLFPLSVADADLAAFFLDRDSAPISERELRGAVGSGGDGHDPAPREPRRRHETAGGHQRENRARPHHGTPLPRRAPRLLCRNALP